MFLAIQASALHLPNQRGSALPPPLILLLSHWPRQELAKYHTCKAETDGRCRKTYLIFLQAFFQFHNLRFGFLSSVLPSIVQLVLQILNRYFQFDLLLAKCLHFSSVAGFQRPPLLKLPCRVRIRLLQFFIFRLQFGVTSFEAVITKIRTLYFRRLGR